MISELLRQYRQRPALPCLEQRARLRRVEEVNHIAACEGWEETGLTRLLDSLYVRGQITPSEMTGLFNLHCL